ncbi:MAG: hypothetical protein C0600_14660 [Ignavibacteria bacterium]|nr:MAG: hypothetical protein C0600_14660 [Ignavibacteria bacterium]
MFISSMSGVVTTLTPNNQTRFQCTVQLSIPLDELAGIGPGRLIAAENVYHAARDKRYTILQIIDLFPMETEKKSAKNDTLTLSCSATPIGQELRYKNARTGPEVLRADTFPAYDGKVEVLDDDLTRDVIHHIAPESLSDADGNRFDIGSYQSNPEVKVGLDATGLLRGNAAVISARPRARTTMLTNLIQSLLGHSNTPAHVVYCDVNNSGTLSLSPQLSEYSNAGILCLNDKFLPSSVFQSMKNPSDRSALKRAVLDYLDMMILPSVLEPRRHDFSYPISTWMRENRIAIFRPNEQTVDQFINEISVDILDGVEDDAEEYISELMNGIAETYRGERFTEKNTKDMLDMVDEFSQESKSHAARRTLYDLKAEIQSVFETYSKDIPSTSRRSMQDMITRLNDDTHSSLTIVQGQKTTDILRFVGSLAQTLIDERLKRLKIRVPVLFIFNNIDDYVGRNGNGAREPGSDRFNDTIQLLLTNGRRHGLGFCLTLENAGALDHQLARRIQNYFIGPIPFIDEPASIADLLNLSEELIHPAVRYEDGEFMFASVESPYHRRVPLPVLTEKYTVLMHRYLDDMIVEQEKKRQEYLAQEEERRKRQEKEREERRKREDKEREERRKREDEEAKAKKEQQEVEREEKEKTEGTEAQEKTAEDSKTSKTDKDDAPESEESKRATTRSRRKRGPKRTRAADAADDSKTSVKEKEAAPAEDTPAEKAEEAPPVADAGKEDKEKTEAQEKQSDRATSRSRRSKRGRKPKKEETSTAKKTAEETAPAAETAAAASSDSAQEKGSKGLTIEEFDPNAGKPSASDTPAGTGEEKQTDEKEKKPARKSTRRRSTRSRKSPSSKKDSEGK